MRISDWSSDVCSSDLFKGGILMEVRTPGPADISGLRNTLKGLGVGEVSLQEFGADREVLLRIQRQNGEEAAQLKATKLVREALGPGVEYRRTELVGPPVGQEVIAAGALAIGPA